MSAHPAKLLVLICSLLVVVACSAPAQSEIPDPDDWYKNQYAPLWSDETWNRLDDVFLQMDETMIIHSGDGDSETLNTREWLSEGMPEWRAEGWLGSKIATYRSERVNPSRTVFTIKWRDRYVDNSVVFECARYTADYKNDHWLVTEYEGIDCSRL